MTTVEHFSYLERLATSLRWGHPLPPFPQTGLSFKLEMAGFVTPKERPRASKGGKFYTPAETRKYEAAVREAAIEAMRRDKLVKFSRPVVVHLQVFDQIHSATPAWQKRLMKERLFFESTGGDLDNKEKAILDAFNGVVYTDDKLVVQVFKTRSYADVAGFKVDISPCGLTKADLVNLNKLLDNEQTNGQKENGK